MKSRAYIQNINFSNNGVLDIIKDVFINGNDAKPKPQVVEPLDETQSAEGKLKAYNYMRELTEAGTDIDFSIRVYMTCVGIFTAIGNKPEREELAKEMIAENLKLQFKRGGGKY